MIEKLAKKYLDLRIKLFKMDSSGIKIERIFIILKILKLLSPNAQTIFLKSVSIKPSIAKLKM